MFLLYKFIFKSLNFVRLAKYPELGKPLRGKLHGIWKIRIGPFRVWYEIDHVGKVVVLKAILHKDEAIKYY
jgi:mRNA interferase RelE/StbE